MTKLLLIRHGESEANNKGFFAGQYDAPLMPKGNEQAEKTAKYIVEKYAPTKIYASDLKRAYCTAVPISKLIGADIITDQGIREINAGKWQKMSFDDLENEFLDEYMVWLNDIGNASCNGGESVKELSERVMTSLTAIAKENFGETIAVVTHATPIRAAQTVIQYGDISHMKNVPWVSNGSVTVFEYNGEWKCVSVSEDNHLGTDKTVFPANV
ncbi:MAG: histidine phosphatase family protein [Clostridia bacterium]|nr:histidine phosphatase family protein [Clostridia bacterium]